MAARKIVRRAHGVLIKNRRDAIALVEKYGVAETVRILREAADDLSQRIKESKGRGLDDKTFTVAQLQTTLRQVEQVVADLAVDLQDVILDAGTTAAEHAATHTVQYLVDADREFRGIGEQPLALNEATMVDESIQGVNASILRRLASSGEPIEGADEEPHQAKQGILERYGVETIGHFERELRRGLIARKSWGEMEKDITEKSPFLQQAPAYWATRIVRTEVMGAYNRAGWESVREADVQLGDMVKILSATFDDRTAADSFAVHGQIRKPEEAFESWYGLYQHPPNRPNDREIVVPHRISWPIPPYLKWCVPAQILLAWRRDGRKGEPPPRPLMTTVPLRRFGRQAPPPVEAEQAED